MFTSSPVDASSRKLYHEETYLLADSSIAKPLCREVEAVLESPVRKMTVEELGASVDVAACRKMETSALKMSTEESFPDSRKISRDKSEVPMDVILRKRNSDSELDVEFLSRKVEKDTVGDLVDIPPRNLYRERSDMPPDVRKMLWNESGDVARRKISRDMMGVSIDSASRKMPRDDSEHFFETRRITRDSMGISQDTGSRMPSWTKGEGQMDCAVRALAMDPMNEAARTPPRKISRDELEYYTDAATIKMLSREKFEALMDTTSSAEKLEFGLEPASRRMPRNELEMSSGSLRRRIPRMPRDDTDSSLDTPTGKMSWVDVQMETPQQAVQREDSASESNSSPGQTEQPDLMLTSQVPWKSSSELYSAGPLSDLVYDGILEKSCDSMASNPTGRSASTPNLPQSRLLAEVESPPRPPKTVAFESPSSPSDAGDERIKEKEKNKKSLKLKNLFKRKHDSSPEKVQSGLQKL